MKKEKNKRRLLKVRWHDHASSAVWQSLEEVKAWVEETKKNPCVTIGYLIYETKDVIVLSTENDGNGSIGNTSLIWKRLIVKK